MSDEYIYPPPKSLPRGSTVIAYLRASRSKQVASIPQQNSIIREYCQQHGLILQWIYADTASGRKTNKRPEFMKMIHDIETMQDALRPTGLLLWAYDRFARNEIQFGRYIYTLLDCGVVVHSLTDPVTDGDARGIELSIKGNRGEGYSTQLSKNIKRGIADTVQKGYNNGGQAPRGYQIKKVPLETTRANGTKRVGVLWVPDPELAPLVVLAWELRAEGKGYAEITKATGGKIYKNKNSWGSHFRNKSYLGIGKAGDIEIPDHHEPIITWELWNAVKEIEKTMPTFGGEGAPTHPRRMSHPSLLSGLSFCIHCGSAMVLHTSRDYRNYQCGKKDRQRGVKDCNARSVNARKADRIILDSVLNRILSPTYVETLLDELASMMVDTKRIDHEIGTANNLLTTTERSITRLLSLAEEAGDIKEIAVRLKQLRQERDEQAARIMKLKVERATEIPEITPEALSLVFSIWREQIEKAIQRGSILAAKRLITQFVSKIEIGREKAVIHYTFPLGIPSDDGYDLSAHKPRDERGFFFPNCLFCQENFTLKIVIL